MADDSSHSFYEFFAGGGMARLGLGPRWRCLLANDIDAKKCAAYRANFGGDHLIEGDVGKLTPSDLPGHADLAWASFPCQDLSLAGLRGGMKAVRSGAFFAFWKTIEELAAENRAPRLIVLENVSGLLTSNNGADFHTLASVLARAGYRVGALEIDAARFLPQSRPRLFIVAQKFDVPVNASLLANDGSISSFASAALARAVEGLPKHVSKQWVWWRLPEPPARALELADIIERGRNDGFSGEETARMLAMMSQGNRARVEERRKAGGTHVGALYRRTRKVNGERVQRAEVRFDGLAGCLRTPGGGSSRQFVMMIHEGEVRVRRMSARESARLMGLPEDYRLPESETAALHVTGDGVAAPAVRWLAAHLLEPLLERAPEFEAAA